MISGGNTFLLFLITKWPKFVYLLVDPGLWSIALVPPVGWTPLTDTTDKQTAVPLCKFDMKRVQSVFLRPIKYLYNCMCLCVVLSQCKEHWARLDWLSFLKLSSHTKSRTRPPKTLQYSLLYWPGKCHTWTGKHSTWLAECYTFTNVLHFLMKLACCKYYFPKSLLSLLQVPVCLS